MQVILDNIRSINNVGSIFRTADAVGVEKIYLGGITPEPLDAFGRPRQQFVKVSLGAEKNVPWEKAKSVSRLIDRLKKDGFRIIAVEQADSSVPYNELKFSGQDEKVVFVFGNEVDGISMSVLEKCDQVAEIPMRGKKESLNVAVSFGIVMFQSIYGNKKN